VDAITALGLKH